MNWRHGLLAIGVLAAAVGLGMAFVPGLGGLVESPAVVPFLLGIGALMAALVRTRSWLDHEEREYRPTDRERPTGIGTPGTDFDGLLERAPGRAAGGNTRLVMIRQSLREAAVDALTAYHGHSPESAEKAIETGTWTDDEYAVEFFTTSGGTGSSLSESVTATFYGEKPFHRRAAHATREIERLTRGEE